MEKPAMKRTLTNRNIQLIALGGAIGTGLFLGSAKAIALAGPVVILVYLICGVAIYGDIQSYCCQFRKSSSKPAKPISPIDKKGPLFTQIVVNEITDRVKFTIC